MARGHSRISKAYEWPNVILGPPILRRSHRRQRVRFYVPMPMESPQGSPRPKHHGGHSHPLPPLSSIPLRQQYNKSVLRPQYQEVAMHWKLQLRLPACLPACLDLRRLARDSWIELMGWKLQLCICALGSNFNLHCCDPRGLVSACGGGWCNPLPAHGY